MTLSQVMPQSPQRRVVCAFCHTTVEADETPRFCAACHAVHHEDCWRENRGCAVYGCAQAPATEHLRDVEMPVSFWGQEHKLCPACKAEIQAAAIRCRHCGATFASARPQSEAEFQQHSRLLTGSSRSKRAVLCLFVLCIFPFTAPLGAVAAHVWRKKHQAELQSLPGLFSGMSRLSLTVGLAQAGLIALAVVLWAVLASS